MDRAVKAVESMGLDGPVDRWRALRGEIHADVCGKGFDAELGTFVQYYVGNTLDAALLMIPLDGFMPTDVPRVGGTVYTIDSELSTDALVLGSNEHARVGKLPLG